MTRSVGVEILEDRVKVLVADIGGRKPRIVAFVEQPIGVEPDEEWSVRALVALREALRLSKAPRGRVVASLDSSHAIIRELTLPFSNMDQLRAVVPQEIESMIHTHALEDLVVDFYRTDETETGSQILAAAIPKTDIKERLDLLREAALDPVALDLDIGGLFNALNYAGAIDVDEPFLILHGTERFSKLILVEDKKPKSVRTIRFSLPTSGGANLFQLDSDTRSGLIAILAKEISRFLLANAAGSSPAHMLVTGVFEDEESASLLKDATRIPTKSFSLLEAVDHSRLPDEQGASARMAVPLGLALKGADIDALAMDFRKAEFSYKKKFEAVKTTALVTIELVIVVMAALALYFHLQTRDIREGSLAEYYDAQGEIFRAVFPDTEAPAPEDSYPEMMSILRKLEEAAGEHPDYPLRQTALEIVDPLFTALRNFQTRYSTAAAKEEDALWILLDSVKVNQVTTPGRESTEVTITGKARSVTYADRLRDEIRKIPLLSTARWDGPLRPHSEGIQFTLKSSTAKQR